MISIYYRGEPLGRSLVSLHKRIPCERGRQTPEPATYWLTLTMPWKQRLYCINEDAERVVHPRLSIGFRFRLGA